MQEPGHEPATSIGFVLLDRHETNFGAYILLWSRRPIRCRPLARRVVLASSVR
jgi:hypothetical protein